jgi:hypothetical protein
MYINNLIKWNIGKSFVYEHNIEIDLGYTENITNIYINTNYIYTDFGHVGYKNINGKYDLSVYFSLYGDRNAYIVSKLSIGTKKLRLLKRYFSIFRYYGG